MNLAKKVLATIMSAAMVVTCFSSTSFAQTVTTKVLKATSARPYLPVHAPYGTDGKVGFDVYYDSVGASKSYDMRIGGSVGWLSAWGAQIRTDNEGNVNFNGEWFTTIQANQWYHIEYTFTYTQTGLDVGINFNGITRTKSISTTSTQFASVDEMFLDEAGNGCTAYYDNLMYDFGTLKRVVDFEDSSISALGSVDGCEIAELKVEVPDENTTMALKLQNTRAYIPVHAPNGTNLKASFDVLYENVGSSKSYDMRIGGSVGWLSAWGAQIRTDNEGNVNFNGEWFTTIQPNQWYPIEYTFTYTDTGVDVGISFNGIKRTKSLTVTSAQFATVDEIFLDEANNGQVTYYDNIKYEFGDTKKTIDFEDNSMDGISFASTGVSAIVPVAREEESEKDPDNGKYTKAVKAQGGDLGPYVLVDAVEGESISFSVDAMFEETSTPHYFNCRMKDGDAGWLSVYASQIIVENGIASFNGNVIKAIKPGTWHTYQYNFEYIDEYTLCLTATVDGISYIFEGDPYEIGIPTQMYLDENKNAQPGYYDNISISYGSVSKTFDFEDGQLPSGADINRGRSEKWEIVDVPTPGINNVCIQTIDGAKVACVNYQADGDEDVAMIIAKYSDEDAKVFVGLKAISFSAKEGLNYFESPVDISGATCIRAILLQSLENIKPLANASDVYVIK